MLILREDRNLFAACVASSFAVYHGFRWLVSRRRAKNEKFEPIGRIVDLYIYPVKSMRGERVFSFDCDWLGPNCRGGRDRQFLVIDRQSGRFYTARQVPALVTICCEMNNGILTLSKNEEKCEVDMREVSSRREVVRASLHDNLLADGLDCGKEVSEWLDRVIGRKGTQLIMFERGLYNERVCEADGKNYYTAFADDAPFMLSSNSSLEDLKRRLDTKVSQRNFRPNLVVDLSSAWDEDNWKTVRIGTARFSCLRPCVRCIMTTVDPDKGQMNKDREPLKTLKTFRRFEENGSLSDPYFGIDLGLLQRGTVCVGDVVWACRR